MRIICRNIAMLLSIAAMLQLNVSCGESKENGVETDTVIGITETVTEPPVFRERDFGGEDITFLTYNEHATKYVDAYILSEENDGSAVSEAVHKRNSETAAMFNVNIALDTVYSPKNEVMSRSQSGQCDFDVIYEWGTNLSSLALDGLLYDFADLRNVDLDRSYWIPNAREDLTVGGKMYIASNYITMNSIDWASMLYYNKTMYNELGYTDSLYDHVLAGTWLFDKYIDAAQSAVSDLNGDESMTAYDRYGIWGTETDSLTGLVKSAGAENTVKNEDGSYSLDMYNEKAVDIYTEYAERIQGGELFVTYEDVWQEKPNLSEFSTRAEGARFVAFGESHVLFMPATLSIAHEFADMEDDYGILPNPRYSSDQQSYYHFIDCNAPMFALPADGSDNDTIGHVLEYMAYLSEQYLLPEYLAQITEGKSDPDPNDKVMLEIIRNSVRYEWTELYALDVTNSIMKKMMLSGSFKSVYNRLYSKAKAEINGCVNTLSFMGLEEYEEYE